MKIYRKAVFQMTANGYEPVFQDSFEYEGSVALLKKNSTAPPPPDPNVVSAAQTRSNQDTAAFNAALNHGNTTTPLGSQTSTLRGYDDKTGAPIYDETISLAPGQQALLDQQTSQNRQLGDISQSMLGRIQSAYGTPMDTSGAPALRDPSQSSTYQNSLDTSGLPKLYGADDLNGARQQVQDALYQKQAAYLDPQWQQRDTAFRTRMANQGVTEGSEAWKNGLDDENRARSFDYGQARDSSITGGGNEMSLLNGISQGNRGQMMSELLAKGGFANESALNLADSTNRARAQSLEEMFAKRNQPLNELNSIRNTAQVQMPDFSGMGGTQPGTSPTDVSSNIWNAYQGQLGIANANQASKNSSYGTTAALGGTALMAAVIF